MYLFDSNKNKIQWNEWDGQSIPCSDGPNSVAFTRKVAAGTYYVAVEADYEAIGDITTTIDVFPCEGSPAGVSTSNPIVIGNAVGSCFNYASTKTNTICYTNNIGNASPDISYKITLASDQTLNVSTCGSEISGTAFYIEGNGLYYEQGTYNCSNPNHPTFSRNLAAGTYYISVEGKASEIGGITLQVSTGGSCRMGQTENSDNSNTTDMDIENVLSLYPNPTSGKTNLNLPGITEPVSVKINDLSGRTVINLEATSPVTEINTENLAEGMYYVSFTFQNKSVSKKLNVTK